RVLPEQVGILRGRPAAHALHASHPAAAADSTRGLRHRAILLAVVAVDDHGLIELQLESAGIEMLDLAEIMELHAGDADFARLADGASTARSGRLVIVLHRSCLPGDRDSARA